jgi:hypothetical protein
MRMLLHARIPHEKFNASVRDGSLASKMEKILETTKAKAGYFTEYDGRRGAIMIINVNDPRSFPQGKGIRVSPLTGGGGILIQPDMIFL